MSKRKHEPCGWYWDGARVHYVQDTWDREHGVAHEPTTEICLRGADHWSADFVLYPALKDHVVIHDGRVYLRADDPLLAEMGCVAGTLLHEVVARINEVCHEKWLADSRKDLGVLG